MSSMLDITEFILSLLGSILYPLFGIIFGLIDVVQGMFYAFAGLGTIQVGQRDGYGGQTTITFDSTNPGSEQNNGGIIYYLFQTPTAKNILYSMTILALVLLVIFMTFAFIKNIYSAKPKKWQEIVGSAIKGLINFIVLPAGCLIGVIAGSVLLRALDGATARKDGSSSSISRQLFIASAYDANKFRSRDFGDSTITWLVNKYGQVVGGSIIDITKDENYKDENVDAMREQYADYYADKLDELYSHPNGPTLMEPGHVYNLWHVNFITLAAGGIFILFALCKISFGMIKRLFMLLVLYVISPAVCSLYPIDDGKAVETWRSEFIKNFFSAYGAVVGMNLYFCILPLINSIKLESSTGLVEIVPLLLSIAGLYMINDFISLATSLIGRGGNALSDGEGIAGKAKNSLQKNARRAVAGGVAVTGAFIRAGANARERKHNLQKTHDDYVDQNGNQGIGEAAYTKSYMEQKAAYVAKGGDLDKLSEKKRERLEAKWEKNANKARLSKMEQAFDKEQQEGLDEKMSTTRKEMGGGALKGFASTLGGSALGGGLSILDTVTDKMGVGKGSEMFKSISGANKAGKDSAKDAIKLGKDTNKVKSALGSGDYEKVSKALTGEGGEEIYKSLKKDDATKKMLKETYKLDDDATAADAAKAITDSGKAAEASTQHTTAISNLQALDQIIRKAIEATYKSANGREQAYNQITAGTFNASTANGKKLSKELQAQGEGDAQQTMIKHQNLQSEARAATINAANVAEHVASTTNDSALANTMNNWLGQLRDQLDKMKNREQIRELSTSVKEELKRLVDKQTDAIKAIKESAEKQAKAVEKAIKEAKKDKK